MKTAKSFLADDGTEIAYNVTGRGRAMVLCDGIGCDQYAWKYFAPYFSDRFRIIRWNYRGHGRSGTPRDASQLTMENIRRDLARMLDHEDIKDVVLVGHSMGVQVVLDYALHHPEQVRALVPICGSYGRPLTTFHDSALGDKIFPYLNAAVQRFPKAATAIWKFMAGSPLAFPIAATFEVNGDFLAREDFQPYFDHLVSMDPTVFFRMLGDLNSHDLVDKISAITQPTLIVAGEKDTFTPAWLSLKMQQKIAGSELLFIPGGSHTAPIEFPELLNLRVEKFFRERLSLRVAA